MKKMSSWLLALFMIMFWIFRIIVTLQAQSGDNFGGFLAFDFSIEVVVLFITIICFVLIVKRSMIGAVVYLCSYVYYFGGYILTSVVPNLMNNNTDINVLQNFIVSIIGILISIFVFFDVLLDKKVGDKHKDKKTDWFFDDEKLDRKLDERADKNQYRHY